MAEPLKVVQIERVEKTSFWESPEKRPVFIVVGVSALSVMALLFYWFVYATHHISTENAYVESNLYPVNCRVMGYAKDVLVTEGEEVKKGQILALLDDNEFKVELSYKEAKFKKAAADLNRGHALIRSNAISKADLETAEATLSTLQADLDGALFKLKYAEIQSPVDGVVGKKSIQPGQFVQPGQSLFVVVPKDGYWVKANFKETQIQKIVPGVSARITVDAYPGITWDGTVESVFPLSGSKLSLLPPENGTGNFTKVVQRVPVKIRIKPISGYDLKPGMSVVPTVIVP